MKLIMMDPVANPAKRVITPASIKKGASAAVYSLTNHSMGDGHRSRINKVLLSNAANKPAIIIRMLIMVITMLTVLLNTVFDLRLRVTVTLYLSFKVFIGGSNY